MKRRSGPTPLHAPLPLRHPLRVKVQRLATELYGRNVGLALEQLLALSPRDFRKVLQLAEVES